MAQDLSPIRRHIINVLLPQVVPSQYPDARFNILTGGLDLSTVTTPNYTTCGTLPAFIARSLGASGMITKAGTYGIRTAAEKEKAWVKVTGQDIYEPLDSLPKPGDFYLLCDTTSLDGSVSHVGIIVKAEGKVWKTADAGQRIDGQDWVATNQCAKYVDRQYDSVDGTLSGEVNRGGLRKPRAIAGWLDVDKFPFKFNG